MVCGAQVQAKNRGTPPRVHLIGLEFEVVEPPHAGEEDLRHDIETLAFLASGVKVHLFIDPDEGQVVSPPGAEDRSHKAVLLPFRERRQFRVSVQCSIIGVGVPVGKKLIVCWGRGERHRFVLPSKYYY